MEDAFRPGGFLEKPPIKHSAAPAKESVTLKKEDVDVIVHEFEVTKAQAEKILSEAGGDLKQALESLIYPKP
ncbi:hypothetical protein FA15DRAFT_663642 [Coprinopsis marcescibilis]|uniref:Nascent polypeptide-associated complex subunit alpha-like UBA domain-containing protein n=1 Tax=Coprinopsis marcescibilis TaxID=230819 RepID=A0A5C3LB22_COPMA|nr:hypothetical protein FA15DRAFT_663642 [Coprinopsis marcescibilis]